MKANMLKNRSKSFSSDCLLNCSMANSIVRVSVVWESCCVTDKVEFNGAWLKRGASTEKTLGVAVFFGGERSFDWYIYEYKRSPFPLILTRFSSLLMGYIEIGRLLRDCYGHRKFLLSIYIGRMLRNLSSFDIFRANKKKVNCIAWRE